MPDETVKISRRKLSFASLHEVIADAKNLHENGYQQLGNWDLSQVCGHLEDWMRFPVEGYPKPSFPMNIVLWIMKHAIGKSSFRKIVQQNEMKDSMPTLPQTVKTPDSATESAAINRLEAAVEQFIGHEGEYFPSPLFGNLTREQALQLQLIHTAHHLSFLIPGGENRSRSR